LLPFQYIYEGHFHFSDCPKKYAADLATVTMETKKSNEDNDTERGASTPDLESQEIGSAITDNENVSGDEKLVTSGEKRTKTGQENNKTDGGNDSQSSYGSGFHRFGKKSSKLEDIVFQLRTNSPTIDSRELSKECTPESPVITENSTSGSDTEVSAPKSVENETMDDCDDFTITLADPDEVSAESGPSVSTGEAYPALCSQLKSPVVSDAHREGIGGEAVSLAGTSDVTSVSNSDSSRAPSGVSPSELALTRLGCSELRSCSTGEAGGLGAQFLSTLPDSGQCGHCDKNFPTPFLLDEHELSVHGIKKIYDCIICPYWSESIQNLQRHLGDHEAIEKLPQPDGLYPHCMDCLDLFESKDDLVGHKCHVYKHAMLVKVGKIKKEVAPAGGEEKNSDTSSANSPLKCLICLAKFDALFLRDHHYKSVHKLNKVYHCDKCKFRADSYREMDRHQRVHQMLAGKPPTFLCEICKDIYTHKQTFQRHLIQDHVPEPPSSTLGTKAMPKCSNTAKTCSRAGTNGKGKSSTGTSRSGSVKKEVHCALPGCKEIFMISSDLDRHYAEQHSMLQPYGCRQCSFRTGSYAVLEQHIAGHFKTKSTTSSRVVPTQNKRKIKEMNSEKNPREKNDKFDPDPMEFIKKFYFCDFCPDKYPTQEKLDEHVLGIHKGQKTFDCDKCEFRSWDEKSLVMHMKSHEYRYEKAHFRCQECGTYLYSSTDFERHHLTEHSNAKPYKCDLCGFECSKNGLFKGHLRRHTRPHVCKVCSHRFAENCDLRRHMLSHEPELPHICETCGKGFKVKRLCEIHARIHTNERNYSCDLCDKKYHSRSGLTSHKSAKHSLGTSYMCDQCGKCFPTSGHMARHRTTHSEEKMFACNVCEKKFKRREHLKCHLRMHTGERPYLCKDCGKRFKQICGLHAHQKIHTGEKPYVCKLCDKAFTYSSSIKNGTCTQCQPRSDKRKCQSKRKSRKRKFDNFDSDFSDSDFPRRKSSPRKRTGKKSNDFDYGGSESWDNSEIEDKVVMPFGCNVCDLRFEYQEVLDAHRISHVKNEDGMLHSEKEVLDSLMMNS
jgi:KRAB domain-containing zinc finger protein